MSKNKITNYYEGIFILNPNINLKNFDNSIKGLQKQIQCNNRINNIIIEECIGIRKLTYKIRKQTEGYFYIVKFRITADCQNYQQKVNNKLISIELQARTDENIIKFIIVKIDKRTLRKV